jgi:hypothetical protein
MAINTTVSSENLDKIKDTLGATSDGQQSLVEALTSNANNTLMSNVNYLNTLLQIQQSQASLEQNTQGLQGDISTAQSQMADATYESRSQQAQSGVGSSGIGALKSVNTQANDSNLLKEIKNTASANRTTRETMDLRNANIQQSLLDTIGTQLNQAVNEVKDYGDITVNGKTYGKDDYGSIWGKGLAQTDGGTDPIDEDDRKNAKDQGWM